MLVQMVRLKTIHFVWAPAIMRLTQRTSGLKDPFLSMYKLRTRAMTHVVVFPRASITWFLSNVKILVEDTGRLVGIQEQQTISRQ